MARDGISGIRAWISGGTGALGQAFASALLSNGAAGVVLADLNPPSPDSALARSSNVYFHPVDVRSASAVRGSFQRGKQQMGGLDLVVNGAGVAAEHSVQKSMAINLEAVINATEAAATVLGKGGIIVNISSAAGVFPAAEAPLYSATKAGVQMYSRARAKALMRQGVRLNALCPAWVNVGMGIEAEKAMGRERLAEITGIMEADEVAQALIRIVSDPKIVGQAVYVSRTTGVCFPLRGLRPQREAKL